MQIKRLESQPAVPSCANSGTTRAKTVEVCLWDTIVNQHRRIHPRLFFEEFFFAKIFFITIFFIIIVFVDNDMTPSPPLVPEWQTG